MGTTTGRGYPYPEDEDDVFAGAAAMQALADAVDDDWLYGNLNAGISITDATGWDCALTAHYRIGPMIYIAGLATRTGGTVGGISALTGSLSGPTLVGTFNGHLPEPAQNTYLSGGIAGPRPTVATLASDRKLYINNVLTGGSTVIDTGDNLGFAGWYPAVW